MLTAAILIKNCEGKEQNDTKARIDTVENRPDFEREVRNVRRRISSTIDLPEIQTGDEEFTVRLETEDGVISEDFNAVNAVRDCIESSGEYRCADRPDERSTICYPTERKDGAVPLYIQEPRGYTLKIDTNGELIELERQSSKMIFSVGLATTNYNFNREDPEQTESALNMVCNDAINYKNEYVSHEEFCDGDDGEFCEDFYLRSLQFGELADELEDSNEDIYYKLKENGFEINDNGGSNFEVLVGEIAFTLNRNMMYEDGEEEGDFNAFMAYEIVIGREAPVAMKDSEEVIMGFEYLEKLLAEE